MRHPDPAPTRTRTAAATALAALLATGLPSPDPVLAETLAVSVASEDAGSPGLAAIRDALARTPDGRSIEIATAPAPRRDRGLKAAVLRGDAALALVPLDVLARESALYAATAIPFLATTSADARRLHDSLAPVLARRLEEDDLVLLAMLPEPALGLATRRPLSSAADLRGAAMWSPGAARRRLAELVAADILPATRAEAADALWLTARAAGTVLQVRGPGWSFYALEGWHDAQLLVIGRSRLSALPEASRAALVEASQRAVEARWTALVAENAAATAALAQAGVTIAAAPRGLVDDLARIGRTMADEWSPGAGADGAEWLVSIGKRTP